MDESDTDFMFSSSSKHAMGNGPDPGRLHAVTQDLELVLLLSLQVKAPIVGRDNMLRAERAQHIL